jgi:hypothetical protein
MELLQGLGRRKPGRAADWRGSCLLYICMFSAFVTWHVCNQYLVSAHPNLSCCFNCFSQGCTNFPKIRISLRILCPSRVTCSWVVYWGPTNIRHHSDLVPMIQVSLALVISYFSSFKLHFCAVHPHATVWHNVRYTHMQQSDIMWGTLTCNSLT